MPSPPYGVITLEPLDNLGRYASESHPDTGLDDPGLEFFLDSHHLL